MDRLPAKGLTEIRQDGLWTYDLTARWPNIGLCGFDRVIERLVCRGRLDDPVAVMTAPMVPRLRRGSKTNSLNAIKRYHHCRQCKPHSFHHAPLINYDRKYSNCGDCKVPLKTLCILLFVRYIACVECASESALFDHFIILHVYRILFSFYGRYVVANVVFISRGNTFFMRPQCGFDT